MVEYYLKRSVADSLSLVGRPYDGAGFWIHSNDKRSEVIAIIDHYNLDHNTVYDVFDRHELPRHEVKDGVSYNFLRIPNASGDTQPFLAIVLKGNLITIAPHPTITPKDVEPFLTSPTGRPQSSLLAILAKVAAEYEKSIGNIGDMVSKFRRSLKNREISNKDFIEFVTIEDRLNDYRTSLDRTIEVARRLSENRQEMFKKADLESLEDISLHLSQLVVSIDSDIQSVRSIQNAYSTIANNTMNQRMKALTVVTILLAIPNVFYGMYGMNIALPFQGQVWAYPAIIGFTALLILLVFIIARRYRLF